MSSKIPNYEPIPRMFAPCPNATTDQPAPTTRSPGIDTKPTPLGESASGGQSKKRGRPVGSKNKPKVQALFEDGPEAADSQARGPKVGSRSRSRHITTHFVGLTMTSSNSFKKFKIHVFIALIASKSCQWVWLNRFS